MTSLVHGPHHGAADKAVQSVCMCETVNVSVRSVVGYIYHVSSESWEGPAHHLQHRVKEMAVWAGGGGGGT